VELTPALRLNLPAFAYEPWDEEVNYNFDVLDAFVGSVVGVNNYAGLWTNGHAYTQGQQVIDSFDSSFWVANVSHTSVLAPGTFAQERLAHPDYWTLKQNSAKYYAESAAESASDAAESAAAAQAAYEAIMPDAPHNGLIYGRIDGTWQQAAPILSPVLQGAPRAPTQPQSTNDTTLATTEFVRTVVGTVPAGVYAGDAPPAGAALNSLWWDSDGGQLYLRYNDGNSTAWVAVNSATGGQATGFLPIAGGALTGYLTLHADPASPLHAATRRFVENTVNNKTYPYLPLAGGTVTGPTGFNSNVNIGGALGVTSNIYSSSTIGAAGDISTSGGLYAAGRVQSAGGRFIAYAPNYGPSLTLWRTDTGARGMWSNGNDLSFGQMDGNGGPVAYHGGFNDSADFVLNKSLFATGSVWATGRGNVFGLTDFGGGYYGIRFSGDGWRNQWNSANGDWQWINSANAGLFTIGNNGAIWCAGDASVTGRVYASNGVMFSSFNSFEYGAIVDGAGNHLMHHRQGGYYDIWKSSSGDRGWVNAGAELMLLTGANGGSLNVAYAISTQFLSASLDIWASRNIGAVGNISTSAGVFGGTLISSGATYSSSGLFVGGNGDTSFGIYNGSGARIFNFAPNWYWAWSTGDGTLRWYVPGAGAFLVMENNHPSYFRFIFNNLGPMGGTMFVSTAAYATVSPRDAAEPRVGLDAVMLLDEYDNDGVVHLSPEIMQHVMPGVTRHVTHEDGTEAYATDYSALFAVYANAIKELGQRVLALEAHHGT